MDRQTAVSEIRRQWRQIIPTLLPEARQKVNGEPTYICACGHGTNGDGLTRNPKSADGNGLKCFGCGWSGDIIDLYRKETGADYNTALQTLGGIIGIDIDRYTPTAAADFTPQHGAGNATAPAAGQAAPDLMKLRREQKTAQQTTAAAAADFTEYYDDCRKRLALREENNQEAVVYLAGRGISIETAKAAGLGYDPAADPAAAPAGHGEKKHPCKRIIIPTGKGHYVGRSIDPSTPKQFAKMNPAGTTPGIFNYGALYTPNASEVFVTEGAFDALSIIEAGAPAIAINSTSNADKLLKLLERKRPAATLVLAFDNDKAGSDAAAKLRDGCTRLNIDYITADICGGHKDPNAALQADRKRFFEAVSEAQEQASGKVDNVGYYIDRLMTADIDRFRSDIKSGYANLDKAAGGIYGGLYCIAAISSLGKTTFAAQMADQMAAAGNDVLYFSLEQSKLEIVSKSIARRTAQADMGTAVTSLSIRKGYLPAQVQKAAAEYRQAVGDRLSVIEGNFACNVSFIGEYIRRYIRRNDRRPVAFIDYLQILQGDQENSKQTTRETVDNAVTALKRISREFNIPVFIISSVNRGNYLAQIDFESLKESGGIEYTCDVVWGLQLQVVNSPDFQKEGNVTAKRLKIKEAKAANPRKVQLVCLKNRYGVASFDCYFDYFPANDLFVAADAAGDFKPLTNAERMRMRR